MNPYTQPLTPYEQRLRDEVIYLHTLWHQGPPSQNPSISNPNYLILKNPSRNSLYVSNITPFKKFSNRNKPIYHKKAKKKKDNASGGSGSDPQPDPGPAWPLPPLPPSSPRSSSGWPAFKPNLTSSPRPLPDLEQGKIMQRKVVKCCIEFFTKRVDVDSDEDGEFDGGDGDEDEDYWGDDSDVEESDEFEFLLGLFVENRELRDFYERNQDSGDFYCLVCGGIGVKVGKTFRGCVGLVHHAVAISKTRRKKAHRVFGQVICRVLGWDISRLPTIVLKTEPLSQSLSNSGQAQGYEPSLVSDIQWPYPAPNDKSPSRTLGWPTVKPHTTSVTCTASAEELTRFAMVQLQRKTVEECKKFLVNPSESDIDEDEEDGDEDDLMEEGGSEECEAFKFFLRLFTEGNELRNYYEHRYEHGEFCCLVCSAIGKKGWKRFNGCLGLLQHAFAISRTKKKRAHRAYGQVICKVLGWDVDRIPTVVLKGEPLGCSLAKSSIMQGEAKENAGYGKQDSNISKNNAESVCGINNELARREDFGVHQKNCALIICENSV